MRWPAIPSSVHGVGGLIRVRFATRKVGNPGEPAWGSWTPSKRLICIDRRAEPRYRWRVYFHEVHHAALDDSGLSELITERMEEALCEAYASARMCERFGAKWRTKT
jgi:hypothetical protein